MNKAYNKINRALVIETTQKLRCLITSTNVINVPSDLRLNAVSPKVAAMYAPYAAAKAVRYIYPRHCSSKVRDSTSRTAAKKVTTTKTEVSQQNLIWANQQQSQSQGSRQLNPIRVSQRKSPIQVRRIIPEVSKTTSFKRRVQ